MRIDIAEYADDFNRTLWTFRVDWTSWDGWKVDKPKVAIQLDYVGIQHRETKRHKWRQEKQLWPKEHWTREGRVVEKQPPVPEHVRNWLATQLTTGAAAGIKAGMDKFMKENEQLHSAAPKGGPIETRSMVH